MVKWNSDDENDSVYDDTTYKGNKNFVMKTFNDVSHIMHGLLVEYFFLELKDIKNLRLFYDT